MGLRSGYKGTWINCEGLNCIAMVPEGCITIMISFSRDEDRDTVLSSANGLTVRTRRKGQIGTK